MFFNSIFKIKHSQQFLTFLLITLFLFKTSEVYPLLKNNTESTSYIVGISHKYRFLWFRVAKVGSSTIKTVFRKQHVSMPFRSENFSFDPIRYKNYFKFAFVRNPWDRVVSCYCQKVENKNPKWAFYYSECFDKGFDYFIDFIDRQDLMTADRHIRLQTTLVPTKEIDFIGHLENFESDFQYVLNVIGIQNAPIPKKNPSNHAHYSQYYNEKTKKIIARKYQQDIETFGYQFEWQN